MDYCIVIFESVDCGLVDFEICFGNLLRYKKGEWFLLKMFVGVVLLWF